MCLEGAGILADRSFRRAILQIVLGFLIKTGGSDIMWQGASSRHPTIAFAIAQQWGNPSACAEEAPEMLWTGEIGIRKAPCNIQPRGSAGFLNPINKTLWAPRSTGIPASVYAVRITDAERECTSSPFVSRLTLPVAVCAVFLIYRIPDSPLPCTLSIHSHPCEVRVKHYQNKMVPFCMFSTQFVQV